MPSLLPLSIIWLSVKELGVRVTGKRTGHNTCYGKFPQDGLSSEFAASTRRKFRCTEVFRHDNLLGFFFFFGSEFWRLFRLNDPATQSRKERDMCTASCTLIGLKRHTKLRREKVEFVSTFSSAHWESKLLKLHMLSSVPRRIR